jgi:hypothetical protein
LCQGVRKRRRGGQVQDKVGDDGVALGRQRELGSRRGELAILTKHGEEARR